MGRELFERCRQCSGDGAWYSAEHDSFLCCLLCHDTGFVAVADRSRELIEAFVAAFHYRAGLIDRAALFRRLDDLNPAEEAAVCRQYGYLTEGGKARLFGALSAGKAV